MIALAGFFGLFSPSSTTAADYTSAEVRQIIRLLREDDECRDTRLGDYFSLHNNSLELWERVLGKPTAIVGRDDSPTWTFTTRDGALTVGVGIDLHSGKVPFVTAYGNGHAAIGINANETVDSDSLKATILRIKHKIDPRESLAFQKQLEERHEKERLAEDAANRQREKQEQQQRDAESAQLAAERHARIAQREKERRQNEAEIEDRKRSLEAQLQAENDYYDLRDSLPVGEDKNAFAEQHQAWVARRIEAIKSARATNQDWKNLPLPKRDGVLAALQAGKSVPVLPMQNSTEPEVAVPKVAESPMPEPGVKPRGRPVAHPLSSLNTDAREVGLWVSPDGLRIYFERNNGRTSIFVAQRPNVDSPFERPTRLIEGRHPTLTDDERTLLLLRDSQNGRGESLHVAHRSNRNESFSTPQEITELRDVEKPKTPFISHDGLSLVFLNVSGSSREFVVSSRPTMKAAWSKPTRLPLNDVPKGAMLSWPFLTKDGLTLIAADESESGAGHFLVWTRPNSQAAFSNRREVKIRGDSEVFGRSPFFVEATSEFFFSSTRPRRFPRYFDQQTKSDWDLWTVEEFTLPR